MRITVVTPHAGHSGGIRVIAAYAERLKRRGHTVLVVSQPLPTLSLKDRVKLAVTGKKKPNWMSQHGSHFDGVAVEHRVLERTRPVTDADLPDADVVVATWWETAEWVAKLSPGKGAKVYFIQGDEAELAHDDATRQRILASWKLPFLKITVAAWLVRLGMDRCMGQPIRLVQNAVDTERFTAPQRGKQAVPTVGMIYSTAPLKGAHIMLEAYQIAKAKVSDLRLVVFGDSPSDGGLPWPADIPVDVRPAQEKLPGYYASCDAWLFGTRREGFGLPILEAMACRTPVIGTPAGAAPELIGAGGGILVKAEEPSIMAAAILRIARMSEDEWRQMSDLAHKTAHGYTWDSACDLFEAALKEAAGGVRERAAP